MKTNHNKTTETEIVLVDGEGTMTTIHRQLPAIACRFSAKTDMREVYLSLGSFPWNRGLTCPVVLADQQLQEGLDYQFVLSLEETACLVLTREGLSSQEIIRIAVTVISFVNGETANRSMSCGANTSKIKVPRIIKPAQYAVRSV